MVKLSNNNQIFLIYSFAVVNLLAIILLWWGHSGILFNTGKSSDVLIALGRITGLMAEFFILVELVLIGRITFVEQLFGFDKMNKIHRWIGYGILSFFILHPLLVVTGYAQRNGVTTIDQFVTFLNLGEYLRGIIGFLLFFVAIAISFPIIRKKLRYETWYFTHLVMYVAIVLVLGHQSFADSQTMLVEPVLKGFTLSGDVSEGNLLYYWFVLNYGIIALVLFYRFVRPLYLFYKHSFYIEKIVRETADVQSIYITGKDIQIFNFQSGQYANLTFLQKGLWFTHPFSFSCGPNGKYLRFSIKSLGDFTSKISQFKVGTKVIIDGPMGLFVESQAKTNKFLLIAGGIGITPIRALVETLTQKNKDIVLIYATKDVNDIAFKKELEELSNAHHFVISQVIECDDGTVKCEKGRVDKEKIARLVPDFLERDTYVCGPAPMMKSVVKDLQELKVPNEQIHFEKFSY